jgi:hypothetical protein
VDDWVVCFPNGRIVKIANVLTVVSTFMGAEIASPVLPPASVKRGPYDLVESKVDDVELAGGHENEKPESLVAGHEPPIF